MSSTSAITTANTLYNDNRSSYANNQSYKLTEKSAGILQKETYFFIGNNMNNFLPAVKKNINKMFSEKMPAIESFIQENKIVLSKEADLVKLINFLGNAGE